jgi:hypothetical protein
MAFPASSRPIARRTSFPRSLAAIIEAMTIERLSKIVWFSQARIVGVASGSSTLRRICPGEAPKARHSGAPLHTARQPVRTKRFSACQFDHVDGLGGHLCAFRL